MNKLPISLARKVGGYPSLDDRAKLNLLTKLYITHEFSWSQIATFIGTYANKVRRDAKRLGIKSRDKSKAQSIALETGRHKHPTKGKGHSQETKIKISESVALDWENMTEQQRDKKRQEAKDRWGTKSDEEIKRFREAAGEGVRRAAKEGSALEKFLLEELVGAGYRVEFHKEHWVVRENLQIDLFIPDLNVALEVDGPSHFEDIWGADNLRKNQARDNEKTGLLLQRGCVIIRVRQTQALSEKYKRDTLANVIQTLEHIKRKKPVRGKRHIILGE